ncbi:carboxypeptidase regulatory-like domain protein [SAR86 cluster bacterium SAR86E]|jgi:hypothetical protein|uniref:Carboxypeptidase regulatory-like domain protein n=1 Tax=SAR86 cluster bacterium SAR86E TaxID=1208365 RepID=K6H3A4_9GAMM|nr:carboxypeptidase regulatory-like domain protein [SAR86 cluster bacterium SAR86E]
MKSLRNLFMVAVLIAIPAFGQELTSDISGTVFSSSGETVANASVTITYKPTNSTVSKSTDSNGKFSAKGLRPGGPYSVVVTSSSGAQTIDNLRLTVGDTSRLNILVESIEDVVVVASALDGKDDMGFATKITSDDVQKFSSVTRDIRDFVRLNPFAIVDSVQDGEYSGVNIAGSNTKSNNLKVDGSSYNDDFGLNANGYPGQSNPIQLDTIDQINVRVSPVSVEYGQFEGGVIEVVSKGGTNEFEGSVYAFDRGDSYSGDSVRGTEVDRSFDDTSEGFTFGGPIIKDKAFFFVAFETNDKTTPINFGPTGSGSPATQPITTAEVAQIRADTIATYGFDPLGYTGSNTSTQENLSARFDVDISDVHRLQVNYRESESEALKGSNRNSRAFYFASSEYLKPEVTESTGILLVSNWNDAFTTEIQYNNKSTDTGQSSPIGNNTANYNIEDAFGMQDIYLGVDVYRSANDLYTENDTLKIKGTYTVGNHEITAGYSDDTFDVYNVFIAFQDGAYTFGSYDDFLAKTPRRYSASNSRVGTELGGAASFDYGFESIFVQDEISVSDQLTVTLGLRYDDVTGSAPPKNAGFQETYGFENYGLDGGSSALSWRFGADYMFDDGSALKLVNGTYTTRFPLVWASNAYSNNGVQTASYSSSNAVEGCDPTSNPANVTSTMPQCVKDAIAIAPLRDSTIVTLSPDFDWPTMKVLNVTYEKPMGDWFVVASYLKKDYEQAVYKVLNTGDALVGNQAPIPALKAPDGRPIYNMDTYNSFKVALNNQGGGSAEIFTIGASRAFNDGASEFSINYTNQNVNEITGGNSSTANSSFGKSPNVNPNAPRPGTSAYETEHRLVATLKSTHYFFGADKPTTFSLFAERRSGYPISAVFESKTADRSAARYQREAFGFDDGLQDDNSNFLVYAPSGINDPLVCWVSCTSPDLEFAADAMRMVKALNLTPGQIAAKGTANAPWNTTIDLKITQILPGFRDEDEFVLTLGIQNLLNMLNDDWGTIRGRDYTGTVAIFDVDMTEDFSRYILSEGSEFDLSNPGDIYTSFNASLWRAQLGFKYNFKF